METGMIVTTTILITLCVLPFILIYRNTTQKETELKNKLIEFINKGNGQLTDSVIKTNFAIGLDGKSNRIYFYKEPSEAGNVQIINLNEVSVCEIKKDVKCIRNGKSNHEVVQNVALVFTDSKNKILNVFELYDYDNDIQLNGEIALADIWKRKVTDLLQTKNKISENRKTEKSSPVLA